MITSDMALRPDAESPNHTNEHAVASPRFDGHRRKSWVVDDYDELTELRARQRTYEGAYVRAAFANLIYALIILKLFSADFSRIGLLWVVLAGVLLSISLYRRGRDYLDFSDSNIAETGRQLVLSLRQQLPQQQGGQQEEEEEGGGGHGHGQEEMGGMEKLELPPASKRMWSTRPFRTGGRAVLCLASVVLAAQITLLVLVLRLPE